MQTPPFVVIIITIFERNGKAKIAGKPLIVRLPKDHSYKTLGKLGYKNSVTALAGMPPDDNLDTDNMPVRTILDHKQSFLECVRRFINDIKEAALSKQEEA